MYYTIFLCKVAPLWCLFKRFTRRDSVEIMQVLLRSLKFIHRRQFCARNYSNSRSDGNITYKRITKDTIDGSLALLRKSFFLEETVCKAVELQKNENAMKEMEMLALDSTREGASLVAVDENTKSTIGTAINKLHVKSNRDHISERVTNIKEPSTLAILQIVNEASEKCGFYELCKGDCTMEMFLLSVAADYRKMGVAKKLFELSAALCVDLHSGRETLMPLDNEKLPSDLRPKLVFGICTTAATQKISVNVGFPPATKFDYGELSFNGKTFAESAGSDKCAIVYYKIV